MRELMALKDTYHKLTMMIEQVRENCWEIFSTTQLKLFDVFLVENYASLFTKHSNASRWVVERKNFFPCRLLIGLLVYLVQKRKLIWKSTRFKLTTNVLQYERVFSSKNSRFRFNWVRQRRHCHIWCLFKHDLDTTHFTVTQKLQRMNSYSRSYHHNNILTTNLMMIIPHCWTFMQSLVEISLLSVDEWTKKTTLNKHFSLSTLFFVWCLSYFHINICVCLLENKQWLCECIAFSVNKSGITFICESREF